MNKNNNVYDKQQILARKGPCLILDTKKLHFTDFFSLEMLQIFFHIIFGRNNEDFCILCSKDKR